MHIYVFIAITRHSPRVFFLSSRTGASRSRSQSTSTQESAETERRTAGKLAAAKRFEYETAAEVVAMVAVAMGAAAKIVAKRFEYETAAAVVAKVAEQEVVAKVVTKVAMGAAAQVAAAKKTGARAVMEAAAVEVHCKIASLVTWLVHPFGLLSILLGGLTRILAYLLGWLTHWG